MENNSKVSIIINCFNCEEYLKQTIESIIVQTHENWEIIFWDNQSTDKSAEILKSFNDMRIKYFYAPEHTSLGEGRNLALQKVTGEFISFLDGDDWYEPTKLERTLQYFDDHTGLVYTNGYKYFQIKQKSVKFYRKVQPTGKLFLSWLKNYRVMIPSVMFRKEVLDRLPVWLDNRFSMIEEFDFFIHIADLYEVNYCPDALCYWRVHSNSLTWTKSEKFLSEYKMFRDKLKDEKPAIFQSEEIKHYDAKIAYREFLLSFEKGKKTKRIILKPYIFISKKVLAAYLISFFGYEFFRTVLTLTGKRL